MCTCGNVDVCFITQSFDDHQMKSAALDVFTFVLENSPSSVREFVMHESSSVDDVRPSINLSEIFMYMYVNLSSVLSWLCGMIGSGW